VDKKVLLTDKEKRKRSLEKRGSPLRREKTEGTKWIKGFKIKTPISSTNKTLKNQNLGGRMDLYRHALSCGGLWGDTRKFSEDGTKNMGGQHCGM